MKRMPFTSMLCLSSVSVMAQAPVLTQTAVIAQAPALTTAVQDSRIETLLQQMTLEEKIGQLNQYSAGAATGPGTRRSAYETMIAAGHIGSLFNVVTAKQTNEYQKIAVEKSRLHIPILFGMDVIHGFRTTFPISLGLSATWDTGLIEQVSRLAATESSAQGIRWTFSPMIDIARDARWGRISEGAGEDPFLGSAIAAAYVRGYQGKKLDDPTSILACAKHYVGYGASEGGRDYNTTDISERNLRQVYLPPFHVAAQVGAATFMSAFNSLNGVPASSNAFTLDQVLRKEWGFQGLVVSDWGSIRETMAHGIANEGAVAARKSFLAGVDMDMENDLYFTELPGLVKSGAVPMARVDEAVRRVLRLKFALGLFEKPYVPGDSTERPLPAESLLLARTAAEKSFVLLKNAPVKGTPLLPLAAKAGRKLALIGPLADGAQDMLGSWFALGRTTDVTTLRAALSQRAAQEQMTLLCAKGVELLGDDESGIAEALRVAKQADLVILTLGEKGEHTGEAASRAYLNLGGKQQKLMEAVCATGKPVVLLLFNGRPLTITWAAQHVPAILDAWFPGVQAGPALVRALFGDVNPSGHLTACFPRTVGQEPLYYNALNTGRPVAPHVDLTKGPGSDSRYISRYIDELNAPLYPFGHGLSYTTFTYSPVSLSAKKLSAAALNEQGAGLTVSAEVTNSGKRAGVEVVQCYIRLTGTSITRPVRELKGFQRLELAPGQSQRVEFKLSKDELAFWNLEMKHLAEPAALSVWIAPDSASGTPVAVEIAE